MNATVRMKSLLLETVSVHSSGHGCSGVRLLHFITTCSNEPPVTISRMHLSLKIVSNKSLRFMWCVFSCASVFVSAYVCA